MAAGEGETLPASH